MRRSIGVTISAVIVFIGCAFTLLFAGLMVLGSIVVRNAESAAPAFVKNAALAMSLIFVLLAAWGIATGVGLLQLRPWARVSMLVFSALLAFFTILPAIMMLFVPLPMSNSMADPELAQRIASMMRIFLTAFYGGLAALGVWWVIYFSRRAVRAQFDPRWTQLGPEAALASGASFQEPPMRRLGRPISITVIGVYMIVGPAMVPLLFWMWKDVYPNGVPMLFFGVLLSGAATLWFFGIYGAVQLAAAIGLLRLEPWGRTLAIATHAILLLNALISFGLPGSRAKFVQAMQAAMVQMQSRMTGLDELPNSQFFANARSYMWMGAAFGILVSAVILWFLVREKEAFYRPKIGAVGR